MRIVSQTGNIIEDIAEFGLVNDTLCALQMNNAVRHGVANQYGFDVNYAQPASQGHKIALLSSGVTVAAGQSESHSYSWPLPSSVIGVLADRMLNIGRTSKLQLVLVPSNIIPITGGTNAAWTAAASVSVTLSNFSLQCEYVDIGLQALSELDKTLINGKAYSHGITYRSTSTTLPSTSGSVSLLAGLRGSSVKSLFARFVQNGVANTTNGLHGKYNSFNPSISSINFNIGGIRFPQNQVNPLLAPSQVFRDLQMAVGSFNSTQFQSCIIPQDFCRLSAGGAAQSLTVGATQEYNWNLAADAVNAQSQFIYGQCLEKVARRGLLSGLDCTSAPIFLELNIATAPTNPHTVYVIAMLDSVLIHDVRSGDISTRV
jgi:hypothetical protein